MQVRFWEKTDAGLVRKSNEDATVALPQFGIFSVCDGCGGRKGGQQASSIAGRRIAEEGVRLVKTFEDYRSGRDRELRAQILQQIARIFDEISAEIYQFAQTSDMVGMATTAIQLTLLDNSGFIGHVGDSRLYLVRHNKIYQLTEDHSLFQKLVNAGKLTPDDYDRFPYKHVISRSLGSEPTVETDTLFVDLQIGDIFILCSDGVSDLVKPVEMLNVAHYQGAEHVADQLLAWVLDRGAHDNATVVVVEIQELNDESRDDEIDTGRSIDFTARMALLGDIKLFQPLNNQELARVLRIVYEENYSDGQAIIREGEEGDCLYMVAEGQVQISLRGVPLSLIGHGHHFGELALVEQSTRSASAHARGNVSLLRISKDDFFRLTQEDPVLANKLLWVFLESAAARIRELSGRLTHGGG